MMQVVSIPKLKLIPVSIAKAQARKPFSIPKPSYRGFRTLQRTGNDFF